MSDNIMSLFKLYFSVNGRISRYTLWLYFILPYIAFTFFAFKLDPRIGTLDSETGIGLFSAIVTILFIYPSIALFIKRFHDRGRSGWWFLILLIPLLNIWFIIEAGFLRGTVGPNRYGEDPIKSIE